MTQFMKKSFSVGVGGKDYADGWDRIFGKKDLPDTEPAIPAAKPIGECNEIDCPLCDAGIPVAKKEST